MTERDLAIGWCMGDTVPAEFLRNLLNLQALPRLGTYVYLQGGPDLGHTRSQLVEQFLKVGDWPWLLMVDTDVLFDAADVEAIIDKAGVHKADVCIGVYPDAFGSPVMQGMGFTLISRHALETVGPKPFTYLPDGEGGHLGEDVSFLHRVKEAKLKIHVSSVHVKHLKPVALEV